MSKLSPTQLKQLKAKWNKKLQKSGFKDIENSRGDIIDHKTPNDLYKLVGFRPGFMDAIRDYFTWAEEMVQNGTFHSARDKKLWLLHSMGLSTGEISRQGRTDGPKKTKAKSHSVDLSQSQIFRRLKKIRAYLKLQKIAEEEEWEDHEEFEFKGAA